MDFTSITNSWGYILSGAAYTVQLTAITAVGGLFLGTLLALCHISEKRWLSAPAKLYINLMRGNSAHHPRPRPPREDRRRNDRHHHLRALRGGLLRRDHARGHPVREEGTDSGCIRTWVILCSDHAARRAPAGHPSHADTSLVYVISGNDFMGSISKIAQRDGQLVLMYSFAAVCYLAVSLSLSLLIRRLQTRMRTAQAH